MTKVNDTHEVDENGDMLPWMQDWDVYALYDVATDMRKELVRFIDPRRIRRITRIITELDQLLEDCGLPNGSTEEEKKATKEMVASLLARTRKESVAMATKP